MVASKSWQYLARRTADWKNAIKIGEDADTVYIKQQRNGVSATKLTVISISNNILKWNERLCSINDLNIMF